MTENLLVSLNDIEEKEASWLVPQRMPKGQIIILAGDGGSGKTSCWCSLAAAISTGAQVFFDETPKEFFESEPQKVLFFSSEDSLEYALFVRDSSKWRFRCCGTIPETTVYKGEVTRMSDLPIEPEIGDVYKVSGKTVFFDGCWNEIASAE